MPSIHLRETLAARLADWVHLHGVPAAQETMSAAEIRAACDRLATKVDEPSFRRRELADLGTDLHVLAREVGRLVEGVRAQYGRTPEVGRAEETLRRVHQDVFWTAPSLRAPYGPCASLAEARVVLRQAIWNTRYALILLAWGKLRQH